MTPRRWNNICDRWLIVVLVPLVWLALLEIWGGWEEALLFVVGIVATAAFIFILFVLFHAFKEWAKDWFMGY